MCCWLGIARFLHIALGTPWALEKDMAVGVVGGLSSVAASSARACHITGVVVPGADAADRQPNEFRSGLAEALQTPGSWRPTGA